MGEEGCPPATGPPSDRSVGSPEDRVKDIQQLFDAMINETLDWEEYLALKKHTEEFLGIKAATHDELTKIILRRIVPGRCVYCPF